MAESYEHIMGEVTPAHEGPGNNQRKFLGQWGGDTIRIRQKESALRGGDYDDYTERASDPDKPQAARDYYENKAKNFGSKTIDSEADTYTPSHETFGWNRQI